MHLAMELSGTNGLADSREGAAGWDTSVPSNFNQILGGPPVTGNKFRASAGIVFNLGSKIIR